MPDAKIDNLVTHAEQICSAVLGPDATTIEISVYVYGEDIPSLISATHEYTIVLDFSLVPELLSDAIQRFCSFLGKNVLAQRGTTYTCLYWGEGDLLESTLTKPVAPVVSHPTNHPIASKPIESVDWMKSDTILPHWLDTVLFDLLGARHEPDCQRYEYNLNLNDDEIKVYLGTYFPRSYAESFCILDALLENPVYGATWRRMTEASLMDIGTGTGGNLIGLLTALAKHCPNLTQVTVHGYDGNKLALDVARTVLASLASRATFKVDVNLSELCIMSLDDLPTATRSSYDFISTFKMGGEIISQGGGMTDDFYHHFVTNYSGLLSNSGLMILLDVTTKPEHTDFLPQLMNEQVANFVREHEDISTIIPVPCHLYEDYCVKPCFTQQEFSISHRLISKDKSRVTYRVLTHAKLAQALHEFTEREAKYLISTKKASSMTEICTYSSDRGVPRDGYKVCT
jgi:hypothetical protein